MKKLIVVMLIIISFIVMTFGTVMAESSGEPSTEPSTETTPESSADVEVMLEGEDTISQGSKTYTMYLKLGKFTNIDEKTVMGFESTLDYSEELFDSVTITQQNGWEVTYNSENKKIVGLVDESAQNVTVAQISFTLKEDVEVGAEGAVSLLDFNISDDYDLNKTIERISKEDITIVTSTEEPTEETIKPQSTGENKTLGNQKQDETVASMILPKAGMTALIIGAIVIVTLIAIGVYVRFKTIKIK